MALRLMADSVTAGDIPVGRFPFVAGYVDGAYAWSEANWQLHRTSIEVGIAVSAATNAGEALDVETGDATPAQAVDWCHMRRLAGVIPTVYIQYSRWLEAENAFKARNTPEPLWWVADWNNTADLFHPSVAHQYANPTLSGGHYDLSAVADHWPGLDAATPAPGAPTSLQKYSPADLDLILGTFSWDEILNGYGQAGRDFLYARAHPTSAPAPTPAPTPTGPPMDQVRAAWAQIGDLLITTAPDAMNRFTAAVAKLKTLP
jgi:hypothetical protein